MRSDILLPVNRRAVAIRRADPSRAISETPGAALLFRDAPGIGHIGAVGKLNDARKFARPYRVELPIRPKRMGSKSRPPHIPKLRDTALFWPGMSIQICGDNSGSIAPFLSGNCSPPRRSVRYPRPCAPMMLGMAPHAGREGSVEI